VKRYVPIVWLGVALALALAACSSGGSSSSAAGPPAPPAAAPGKTLTLPPVSTPPLSGTLTAYLGQSSRDVALNRFQVWIVNGLDRQIRPRTVTYHDALLSRPEKAGRLRTIPSGSYRGFTLDLIEPYCGQGGGAGDGATVTVDYGADEVTVPVDDETHVTGRWADERCAELAIDRVAPLTWTGIRVQGSGKKAIALFQLTATPTGRSGSYVVDTATGTPLYTSAEGEFWTIGRRVSGRGDPVTMELRAKPARCDIHAFGSATGGTTFFVNVTIGGTPAQIRLAMSPELTDQAFGYAGEVCGF
jgi:hypothetical protein